MDWLEESLEAMKLVRRLFPLSWQEMVVIPNRTVSRDGKRVEENLKIRIHYTWWLHVVLVQEGIKKTSGFRLGHLNDGSAINRGHQ